MKRMMTLAVALVLGASAFGQMTPEEKRQMEVMAAQHRKPCPPGADCGHWTPMPHGMKSAGKWWKNSELVQKVGVTDQQVQQMEQIFQETRSKLVDLRANLEKAEIALQPLMEADDPNEAQISAAIDRVAQARASLEKEHAMMLVGIRKVLSVDQWKKLQDEHMGMKPHPGPGMMKRRQQQPPPQNEDE